MKARITSQKDLMDMATQIVADKFWAELREGAEIGKAHTLLHVIRVLRKMGWNKRIDTFLEMFDADVEETSIYVSDSAEVESIIHELKESGYDVGERFTMIQKCESDVYEREKKREQATREKHGFTAQQRASLENETLRFQHVKDFVCGTDTEKARLKDAIG